jgi:putative transposase
MISAPDRRATLSLIDAARTDGARLSAACAELGLTARTVQRWRGPDGSVRDDARPTAARPAPDNRLSDVERERIVATCNTPEFASLPPGQIVPRLADRGDYIASESTMYRVLRVRGQAGRRGRAKAPRSVRPPTTHRATAPRQVWSWDITWLPGPALGVFFHLYLILDIWSRKITGWEVHDRESGDLAALVIEKAVWAEGCVTSPLTLHADNGSPMKAATLRVTLERLGVEASFSRPRVSNDNPFSEALFRTCKYVPAWPERGFAGLEDARAWVADFVRWYNGEHRHAALRFVTPDQRHNRQDHAILQQRHQVYQAARARHPERWARHTRCWQPIGDVRLNPERTEPERTGHGAVAALPQKAGGDGPMAAPPAPTTV